MLECRALSVSYGRHQALKQVDVRVAQGEIVVILGANGAGKTTLLKAIAGLVPAGAASQVTLDGQSITRQPPHRIVEAGLALVPEGRGIFGDLKVRENLLLGAFAQRARAAEQTNLDRVLALFPRLAERGGQLARTMSGGEQQMVAIGRALMSAPTILMLDEPSLGLSPLLCTELFRNLAEVRKTGVGILLVEQNARQSLAIADRAYLLENGEIVGEGPAEQLARDPAVQAAYLGGAAAKAPAPSTKAAAMSAPSTHTPAPMPMPLTPTSTPAGRSTSADALIPVSIADLVRTATQVQAAQINADRAAAPAVRPGSTPAANRSLPATGSHPASTAGLGTTGGDLAEALARVAQAAAQARLPARAPVPPSTGAGQATTTHHRAHDDEDLPKIEVYRRPTVEIYRRSQDGTLRREGD